MIPKDALHFKMLSCYIDRQMWFHFMPIMAENVVPGGSSIPQYLHFFSLISLIPYFFSLISLIPYPYNPAPLIKVPAFSQIFYFGIETS